MKKILTSARLKSILSLIKPWAIGFVMILILRQTGLLAGISQVTHSVLLSSGLKNADTEIIESPQSFDYNFQLKDVDGNIINVGDLKGKVIFLNLWATWCGPCVAEMPGIQNLYNSMENKEGIHFVMLSIDQGAGRENKVNNFISRKKFTFPTYMPVQSLPDQLNVPSIPTTFIISKDGKVVSKKVGSTNFNTSKFKKYLEELASE